MLLLMSVSLSLRWPRIMGDWRSGSDGLTGIWGWRGFFVGVVCAVVVAAAP